MIIAKKAFVEGFHGQLNTMMFFYWNFFQHAENIAIYQLFRFFDAITLKLCHWAAGFTISEWMLER